MKRILVFAISALFLLDGHAALVVNNNGPQKDWQNNIEYQEAQEIAALENDIRLLDAEIAKCQKKKKAWTAATIIGGAGVLATGTAAIVQASKKKEQKTELSSKQTELKQAQTELNRLKKD